MALRTMTMTVIHAFPSSLPTIPFPSHLQNSRGYQPTFVQPKDDDGTTSSNAFQVETIQIFDGRNESSIPTEVEISVKGLTSSSSQPPQKIEEPSIGTNTDTDKDINRRQFFAKSFIAATLIGASWSMASMTPASYADANTNMNIKPLPSTSPPRQSVNATKGVPPKQKQLEPLDIPKIIEENNINVTVSLKSENSKVYVNRTSFEKVQERNYPPWVPAFLRRNPQIIGRVDDTELLLASIFAASFMEVFRTTILYPVLTVKTRVQATPAGVEESMATRLESQGVGNVLKSYLKPIEAQIKAGKLYTGYIPFLITTVPASGAYFGIRDVVKREMVQGGAGAAGDLSIALFAALIADVVSLVVKTPALIFSVRQQAATKANEETEQKMKETSSTNNSALDLLTDDQVVDIQESIFFFAVEIKEIDVADASLNERNAVVDNVHNNKISWDELRKDFQRQFPTILLTDLPYLFLRIILLRGVLVGNESVPEYEVLNIIVACIAAFLTTPFDVARTRILVDSDRDPTNGLDGGTGEGILEAMDSILREGGESTDDDVPRVENLFSGWLERVVYFGVAVAFLDPIRILGYLGIRDLLLLLDILK